MTYLITPAQFEPISDLSAQQRYLHFVDHVAKHQEVWTLAKAGELLLKKNDN